MNIAKKVYDTTNRMGLLNLLSDKMYTRIKYRLKMGRPLNLQQPETFTEKLNWLKLYDHDPRYISLVDKWEVTEYVRKCVGEGYCIKKFGLWNSFDEIDFAELPEQFVLKCTNDSGGIVICRDKSKLDKTQARKILERSLKRNYYWHNREWPYKGVKPRILAEQYLSDNSGGGCLITSFSVLMVNRSLCSLQQVVQKGRLVLISMIWSSTGFRSSNITQMLRRNLKNLSALKRWRFLHRNLHKVLNMSE